MAIRPPRVRRVSTIWRNPVTVPLGTAAVSASRHSPARDRCTGKRFATARYAAVKWARQGPHQRRPALSTGKEPLTVTEAALSSLRVLDLSRVLAGPFCTQLLGDHGADILKVEDPHAGDGTRSWGPPWAGDQSAYFLSANRNKRSLCINLKSAAGRALVAALAERCDVLIENFRPGTLARWGLDYETLAERNPGLVFCSITGYGQTGPERDQPGYDFVIQAQGGLMSITGPEAGPPTKVGVAIADITAGLYAASAILSALWERERSGRGQAIDIALFDAQIGWLANVAQNHLVTGAPARRYGNAHPSIVPYQPFATSDGSIAVAMGTDDQYARWCAAVERPELACGAWATNAGRVEGRAQLIPLLEALFRTRTNADWLALLRQLGVPASPILSVAEALAQPQVGARAMVQQMDHPSVGTLRLVGPVAKLARTPARITRVPPTLGQHTDEVLREVLGSTPGEIAQLRAQGAIA